MRDHRFTSVDLFGAVCPESLHWRYRDDTIRQHLSHERAPGRDQSLRFSRCHRSNDLRRRHLDSSHQLITPKKIALLPLPPDDPQTQPSRKHLCVSAGKHAQPPGSITSPKQSSRPAPMLGTSSTSPPETIASIATGHSAQAEIQARKYNFAGRLFRGCSGANLLPKIADHAGTARGRNHSQLSNRV